MTDNTDLELFFSALPNPSNHGVAKGPFDVVTLIVAFADYLI
jgi:hypothetical protein